MPEVSPLGARQRTLSAGVTMSVLCHFQTKWTAAIGMLRGRDASYLVGAGDERGRQGQAERLGGPQVDDQIERCWELNRKLTRCRALEDTINILR